MLFLLVRQSSILNFSDLFSYDIRSLFYLNKYYQDNQVIAKKLGLLPTMFAVPEQVHSSNVICIDKPGTYKNIDGLIKNNPNVNFVSSVSGEVVKIEFGHRRSIEKILIKNNFEYTYLDKEFSLDYSMTPTQIKSALSEFGAMSFIRQFPFSKIADPSKIPKCIIISLFNTAPYLPDLDFILNSDNFLLFKKALSFICMLTDGKVHLNCRPGTEISMTGMPDNIQINYFTGPHPAGNPGIQIHHIDPINGKNDIVWSISCIDMLSIGWMVKDKKYHNRKMITLGGISDTMSRYVDILRGAKISSLLSDVKVEDKTIVSGDLLSGKISSLESGIGHLHETISIIKHSADRKFLGWILPGLLKPSLSRTFLSSIVKNKDISHTNNLNGSIRSIIPFGRWEKMLPMKIFPDFLIKSIIAKDLDMMENLGIYECVPEDFALCAYVCQSKVEVSDIIQQGLDRIEGEG